MKQHTGQCHCGKNTFKMTAAPEFQFICYCQDCREMNSSGHLCGMAINESDFTPAAATNSYTYPGGSGQDIVMHFCPVCATHLYAYPTAYQGKVVIRANTLTDADFKPQQALFVESAFSWDAVQQIN